MSHTRHQICRAQRSDGWCTVAEIPSTFQGSAAEQIDLLITNRKEGYMEPTSSEKAEVDSKDKEKKKRTRWGAFFNFLAAGGFMLIIVAGVVIAIAISILFK
jgi:hypothetical protein